MSRRRTLGHTQQKDSPKTRAAPRSFGSGKAITAELEDQILNINIVSDGEVSHPHSNGTATANHTKNGTLTEPKTITTLCEFPGNYTKI